MTGPEHYREAEQLLDLGEFGEPPAASDVERAQVHATLALAAATGLGTSEESSAFSAWGEWYDVAGKPQVPPPPLYPRAEATS